jgi:hypothetical protein
MKDGAKVFEDGAGGFELDLNRSEILLTLLLEFMTLDKEE